MLDKTDNTEKPKDNPNAGVPMLPTAGPDPVTPIYRVAQTGETTPRLPWYRRLWRWLWPWG